MGVYAANGSLNVTVVNGSTRVGIYALDGSINVVEAPTPVTRHVGAYHPSGAWYVTLTTIPVSSLRAPDGSLYVSQAGGYGTPVTVTGGAFGGGGGLTGTPQGLLLIITRTI